MRSIQNHQPSTTREPMHPPHPVAPPQRRAVSLKQAMVGRAMLLLCMCVPFAASVGAADRHVEAASEARFTRNQQALAVSPAPFATNGLSNLVPRSWVVEAVRQQASQRWPVFAIGTPVPCSNGEGELICYQVPVAVGTNRFPDLLTPPPAGQVSPADLHTPGLWAVSQYWTFDVSARKSYYPVVHFGGGLPPFLVTYHKARQLAQAALNSSEVQLKHYSARRPAEEYYEFAADSGRRVLINARSLRSQELARGQAPFARAGKAATAPAPVTAEQRAALKQDYQRKAGDAWNKISRSAVKGE
jgi:hypothetical protein